MPREGTIKRTYVITPAVDRKLAELAKSARRDKSAQLCVLVERAHAAMVEKAGQKQAQASE